MQVYFVMIFAVIIFIAIIVYLYCLSKRPIRITIGTVLDAQVEWSSVFGNKTLFTIKNVDGTVTFAYSNNSYSNLKDKQIEYQLSKLGWLATRTYRYNEKLFDNFGNILIYTKKDAFTPYPKLASNKYLQQGESLMQKKSVISVLDGLRYSNYAVDVFLDTKYVGAFLVEFGLKFSEWDSDYGRTVMRLPTICSTPGRNFLTEDEKACRGILPIHRRGLEEMVADFGKRWILRVTFSEDKLDDFLNLIKNFAKNHKIEFKQ